MDILFLGNPGCLASIQRIDLFLNFVIFFQKKINYGHGAADPL